MSKTILLSTIHSQNNNFGSVWQAYALSAYLESEGYDVTTLDYRPLYSNGLTSLKRVPSLLAGRILYGREAVRRERKFQAFISSRKLTMRYKNPSAIVEAAPKADVYLIGSDQVWNPDYLCGNDPVYYLDFIEEGVKIAYSASAGKILSEDEVESLLGRIADFKCVSLREDKTALQLQNAGRSDAVHTLDPVFLLSERDYLMAAEGSECEVPSGCILVYAINKDPVFAKTVAALKAQTGKQVVQIGGLASKCDSDFFPRDAGPLDFVKLFAKCDLVVTSSFHGVAFSHIMKKNFVTVLPKANHLRIESLLRDAGTTERLASTEQDALQLACQDIDYVTVGDRLGSLIGQSKEYLATALGGA